MVTLTNSAPVAVEQQLKNAGLTDLFERSFSVDAVKRFKPAPEPYRHVAQELGVSIGDLRMVAAHAWDVVGAIRAGCLAAFIARPGKVLYPLGPKPDIVASDFQAVPTKKLHRRPSMESSWSGSPSAGSSPCRRFEGGAGGGVHQGGG